MVTKQKIHWRYKILGVTLRSDQYQFQQYFLPSYNGATRHWQILKKGFMDMENQCSKISNLETIFGTTPQESKELSYKNLVSVMTQYFDLKELK